MGVFSARYLFNIILKKFNWLDQIKCNLVACSLAMRWSGLFLIMENESIIAVQVTNTIICA